MLFDKVFAWLGHGTYRAVPQPVADGGVQPLLVDALGRQQVVVAGYGPGVPSGGGGSGGSGVTVSGYHRQVTPVAAAIARNAPCALVAIWGVNTSEAPALLQLFDRTTLPTAGTAPIEQILIPPISSFSFSPPVPMLLSGIVWAVAAGPGNYAANGDGLVLATVAYQ